MFYIFLVVCLITSVGGLFSSSPVIFSNILGDISCLCNGSINCHRLKLSTSNILIRVVRSFLVEILVYLCKEP